MKKTAPTDGKEAKEAPTSLLSPSAETGMKDPSGKAIKKPKEDPKSARLSNLSMLFKLSSDDLSELAKEFQAPEETSANKLSASMEQAHEAEEESAKEKEMAEPPTPAIEQTAPTLGKNQKKTNSKSKHMAHLTTQTEPRQDSKPSLLSTKPKKHAKVSLGDSSSAKSNKQQQGKAATNLKVTFKFPTPAVAADGHLPDKQEGDEGSPASKLPAQEGHNNKKNGSAKSQNPKKTNSKTARGSPKEEDTAIAQGTNGSSPATDTDAQLVQHRVNTHE